MTNKNNEKLWEKTAIVKTWQEFVQVTIDGRTVGYLQDHFEIYTSPQELAESGTFGTELNERYYHPEFIRHSPIQVMIDRHTEDLEEAEKDNKKRKLKKERELIKQQLALLNK